MGHHLDRDQFRSTTTPRRGHAGPGSATTPGTLVVKREDGSTWIARVFSSAADTFGRVEKGHAEILAVPGLARFPCRSRPAHDSPVSVLEGSGVIVTEYVEGGCPTQLLGGAPPVGEPPPPPAQTARGSWCGRAGRRVGGARRAPSSRGRPKQDLAAAMSFLVSVEDAVAPEGREMFEWLRDKVEHADDAEGLPEAFTHGNYHAWAAVGRPGNLAIASAGGRVRARTPPARPRLAADDRGGGRWGGDLRCRARVSRARSAHR